MYMFDDYSWERLAHHKARKIYDEFAAEGLSEGELPRKLGEVVRREREAVDRLVASFQIPTPDAQMILQLALGDERIARTGCRQFAKDRSMEQAAAAITVFNGEEYLACA